MNYHKLSIYTEKEKFQEAKKMTTIKVQYIVTPNESTPKGRFWL
jgi:hypothetical protein